MGFIDVTDVAQTVDEAMRANNERVWAEGYAAHEKQIHEGGHWANDVPRAGMRTWVPCVIENPYRVKTWFCTRCGTDCNRHRPEIEGAPE